MEGDLYLNFRREFLLGSAKLVNKASQRRIPSILASPESVNSPVAEMWLLTPEYEEPLTSLRILRQILKLQQRMRLAHLEPLRTLYNGLVLWKKKKAI